MNRVGNWLLAPAVCLMLFTFVETQASDEPWRARIVRVRDIGGTETVELLCSPRAGAGKCTLSRAAGRLRLKPRYVDLATAERVLKVFFSKFPPLSLRAADRSGSILSWEAHWMGKRSQGSLPRESGEKTSATLHAVLTLETQLLNAFQ